MSERDHFSATPRDPAKRDVILDNPNPILVYDGDCGFCRRWVRRFRVVGRGRVDVEAAQTVAAKLQIPEKDWRKAAQFIGDDGERSQGAEAIFRAHAAAGRPGALTAYRWAWPFAPISRGVYWVAARSRRVLGWLTGWLHDKDLREDPWTLTRSLYLKALGLVMFLAVSSYWSQIQALNGADGIMPAADLVDRVRAAAEARGWTDWETFRNLPSLYALNPTDGMLHGLAGMATVGALLLVLGVLPGPALVMVLVGWSSIVAVGGTFTGYQWDIFNIEVCFASLFVAPWSWRPEYTRGRRASVGGKWLLRIILFKFMLLQGLVKWQSGDAPWEELTALQYHYWTQPIPHAVSWYAHHLPVWVHEAGVIGMFVVELALPFLIFGTRRTRQVAAVGFVGLMVAIMATGNYGTFNLLALALCITLLDDGALRRLVPEGWRDAVADTRAERSDAAHLALRLPRGAVVGLLVLLNVWMVAGRADVELPESPLMTELTSEARSLHLSTTYGAFSNMTEDRPEVLFEGSRNGKTWSEYRLRYKTLAVDQHHGFAASHMPRLDWQLWFAALRRECQRTRWYLAFMARLLEGQPAVVGLLADNPFPGGPPKYIRSSLWSYTFTSWEEHAMTGRVWSRERVGDYCPTVTLKDGKIAAASLPR